MKATSAPCHFKARASFLPIAMWVAFFSSAEAASLDFKACVETALGQNPEMEVSEYRLKQAEYALAESNANRMPQVTASFTGTNSNNAMNVFGMKLSQRDAAFSDFGFNATSAAEFGAGNYEYKPDDLNNPGSYSDFNSRLEVMIPVWNGGKVSSYQNQAKAMIKAAQHGDKAVQQYLTYNVYQAYEGVHTARAFVSVAQQAVKASEAYVKTTQNLVDQGVVVRSELLSANVHLSEAKTALEKAKTQELIAKDNLKMLMAVDPNMPLEIGPRVDVSLPANSIGELTTMATTTNPKLEAQREEARSSRAAIDASKADQYPSFNIMARGEFNDDTVGFDSSSYTVAGIVSWKITDFGITSNRINKARAAARQKQAALRSQENQTRLAVLKSWRTLKVAEKQVSSNRLAVEQAEEAQRLIMKRYKNGVSTMTEVLASQAQLDKARADLVQSIFEKNIHKAKLRLEAGVMSIDQL
ncbi:TolC family protein [Hydrogenovibrio crunogenus]|uniref:TolC family protein n=1 Tax=Hydrogenovibrio crunogenus TaxID=39765 RepID=A0A4P7NXQ8_9GAMM|nr:TolC family protein [Hydrogenovibrio crunogenus]QBZ82436.1 TolC family protein [Hydrogenovibrio crunogenus]RUM91658.1 MAG: TolC family protein [Thiomicrospira sp.]